MAWSCGWWLEFVGVGVGVVVGCWMLLVLLVIFDNSPGRSELTYVRALYWHSHPLFAISMKSAAMDIDTGDGLVESG